MKTERQDGRARRPGPEACLTLLAVFCTAVLPNAAKAVPSFARQMDSQCILCHTEFPILTSFGEQFKLNGYSQSAEQTNLPPIALMFQPSFTHTAGSQAGGAAPGFDNNNNGALTQFSIFYSGRLFGPYAKDLFGPEAAAIANKIGIFCQTTYDGVAKTWALDNTELRFADTGSFGKHAVTYGVYLNNNPTMQDPWNSTPAWGFPFSGSSLVSTPAAATLIDGGVSQQVAGLGAYAMLDRSYYFDFGAYRSLSARFQRVLGEDPTGETQIAGLAPYWRFAFERPVGKDGRWEVGTFGMLANTYPGRDQTEGTDRLLDVGLDSEYQRSIERNDLTVLLTAIHENQSWNASHALGDSSYTGDSLRTYKATADYLYDKTLGAAVQYFAIDGGADQLLYPGSISGSPNSDGVVLQLNYLPFNKHGGPPFWPRSNVKFSIQYTIYNRFDGSRFNYDGSGRNASANNTLYFEAWIVF